MGGVDRKDWSSEKVDVGEEDLSLQNWKLIRDKPWHSFVVIREDVW
jgi:hypothetical protein